MFYKYYDIIKYYITHSLKCNLQVSGGAMTYTIGEFSKKTGISTHTLRYYEKEGLLDMVNRKPNGLREFTDHDLEHLKIILCLKATGMSNSNIKEYIMMSKDKMNTFESRKDVFVMQKKHIEREMNKLSEHLETVKYKIWYYDNIEKLGDENDPLNCDKMRAIYNDKYKV